MKFRKGIYLSLILLCMLAAFNACSQETTEKTPSGGKSEKKSALSIVNASAKQNGQEIIVHTKMRNSSTSAQGIKPELFVLLSNHTVFSPEPKSDIPRQIPAQTDIEFSIVFNLKNLEGTIPLQLAFQPVDPAEPQQFFKMADMALEKAVIVVPPNTSQAPTTPDIPKAPVQDQTPPSSSRIVLKTQNLGPVVVQVPVGWDRTSREGGNFIEFKYTNPKDTHQEMRIIYSSCAGCGYPEADPSDVPDPLSLVSQKNIVQSNVFKSGLAAGYQYYQDGNPYPGHGVVKMKRYVGYAYVDIVLPESEKPSATKILNSFQFLETPR